MKHTIASILALLLVTAFASAAQFTLNWSDNSTNETGFTIERAPGLLPSPAAFAPIANVGANVTVYVDATLADSTAYSYRVCAFNAAGKSAYSNTASGTTKAPVPAAPGTPTLTSPADYVPPIITTNMTFKVQGENIIAMNVEASSQVP